MVFNLRKTFWTFCLCFIYVYNVNSKEDKRCGICPMHMQKICGFDFATNSTFIFDNTCIMDLYNCIHKTDYVNINYDNCLYFGNFAYVHGFKYEDYDYGEDHININPKKNPDLA